MRNGPIDKTLTTNFALKSAIQEWTKMGHSFQSSMNMSELRIHATAQLLESMTDADKHACPLFSQHTYIHTYTHAYI